MAEKDQYLDEAGLRFYDGVQKQRFAGLETTLNEINSKLDTLLESGSVSSDFLDRLDEIIG